MATSQQYRSVGFLGVSFMLMFMAFNSLQNMIASLYTEMGFSSLGQFALFGIYLTFGFTTFVSSYFIQKLGYKKTMFLCGLGYAIFELTGLLVTSCQDHKDAFICGKGPVYFIVILGSMICGFSAGLIWIAQGSYVSDVASDESKGQLFGLFWGLMMASQIFGNVFSTFILGNISPFMYFAILSVIGSNQLLLFLSQPFGSSFMFLFLPSVDKQKDASPKSLSQRVKDVLALANESGSTWIHLYYAFTGVTVAFYAGFLYKLIVRSYTQKDGQSDSDFKKDLKLHEGFVFIALGCSQVLTGILMNRFSEKFNKYRLASFGTLIVEAAAVCSLVCYFLEQYELCFLASFLWGCSETFLQSNTGALISLEYPGRLEAFSVFRVFFAIGVTSTLLLNIILSGINAPDYVFVLIVLGFQLVMSVASQTLQSRLSIKGSQMTESFEQKV